MKATGNMKTVINNVGKVQDLIGRAMAAYDNDRTQERADKLKPALKEALDICIEIRGMYDPL